MLLSLGFSKPINAWKWKESERGRKADVTVHGVVRGVIIIDIVFTQFLMRKSMAARLLPCAGILSVELSRHQQSMAPSQWNIGRLSARPEVHLIPPNCTYFRRPHSGIRYILHFDSERKINIQNKRMINFNRNEWVSTHTTHNAMHNGVFFRLSFIVVRVSLFTFCTGPIRKWWCRRWFWWRRHRATNNFPAILKTTFFWKQSMVN